jgi:hypothetical protein
VVVTTAPGQANIRSLKLDFPQRLPAQLETIQDACPEDVFDANPAACPEASVIGAATVQTPILSATMAGDGGHRLSGASDNRWPLTAAAHDDRDHRPERRAGEARRDGRRLGVQEAQAEAPAGPTREEEASYAARLKRPKR